jgi:ER degradation enhancer, mannosidase alpha-like 1
MACRHAGRRRHLPWPFVLIVVFCQFYKTIESFTEARRFSVLQKVGLGFSHAFGNYWRFGLPFDELDPISCQGRGYGASQRQQRQREGKREQRWEESQGEEAGPHLNRTTKGEAAVTTTNIVQRQLDKDDEILGGFCLTLIDSLDTLVLLGQHQLFKQAVSYLTNLPTAIEFSKLEHEVIVFEVVIRVLGGLISAHLMLSEPKFQLNLENWYDGVALLNLALDLGQRLLPAFTSRTPTTTTGLPFTRINLASGYCPSNEEGILTNIAAAGTCILEFGLLSHLTNRPLFKQVALRATSHIFHQISVLNLIPSTFNVMDGSVHAHDAGIGASNDSFYEYLLKGSQLLTQLGDGPAASQLEFAFHQAYQGIMTHMKSEDDLSYYTVNYETGYKMSFQIDALAAFFPGLQSLYGDLFHALKHYTFYLTQFLWYDGLTMERFNINTKSHSNPSYYLRPEFIESTYHLYRATKWPIFLEYPYITYSI